MIAALILGDGIPRGYSHTYKDGPRWTQKVIGRYAISHASRQTTTPSRGRVELDGHVPRFECA